MRQTISAEFKTSWNASYFHSEAREKLGVRLTIKDRRVWFETDNAKKIEYFERLASAAKGFKRIVPKEEHGQ